MSIQITCQSNALQMVARCALCVFCRRGNSNNSPIKLCFDEKGSKFSKWLWCFWRQTEWKNKIAYASHTANKLVSVFVNCQSFALILFSLFFCCRFLSLAPLCFDFAEKFTCIEFLLSISPWNWYISTILNGCKHFIFLDPFFHMKENHFLLAASLLKPNQTGNEMEIVRNKYAKYEKEKKK